jgi:hypothetical protein
MGNLSYCRFRNTLSDLRDCYENIEDIPENSEEVRAREQLIELCARIVKRAG